MKKPLFVYFAVFSCAILPLSSETNGVSQEARYKEAVELAVSGKFEKSLKIFEALKKDFPESARLQMALGNVFYNLKRFEDASSAYRSAMVRGWDLSDFAEFYFLSLIAVGVDEDLREFGDYLVEVSNKSSRIIVLICYVSVLTNNKGLFEDLMEGIDKEELLGDNVSYSIASTARVFLLEEERFEKVRNALREDLLKGIN